MSRGIIIDTKFGKLKGNDGDGVYSFHNIPYAMPPINENRFMPPKPYNKAWNTTYDGTSLGYACIQTLHDSLDILTSKGLSEDCLYLNVYTPYNFGSNNDTLKNVLVYFHGGWLSFGSGNFYDGTSIAKYKDIIFVSINYRLNIAGWLINPHLSDNDMGHGGANGFLDMIESLKWVKDNIGYFGGNKDEITIAGESGGSWGVCALLVSPLARGLFKRSIQMSGTCIESLGIFHSIDEAMNIVVKLKNKLNITNYDELYNFDMEYIVNTYNENYGEILPVIDGYVLPKDPLILYQQGFINAEVVVIGTVIRESFVEPPFNMGIPPQNQHELDLYFYEYLYDKQIDIIKKYYPNNKDILFPHGKSIFDNNPYNMIQSVFGSDCMFKCGSILQAGLLINNPMSKHNVDVYYYQLGYINQPIDQITHCYDLILLTGKNIPEYAGDVAFNPEFVRIGQDFFGGIVNNDLPKTKSNGIKGSLNNGYYIEITNGIHTLNESELNVIRNRCIAFKSFNKNMYRSEVCMGHKTVKPSPPKMDIFKQEL